MPKTDTPEKLKPYIFHGVDLAPKPGETNAVGECPFCGRQKFSVTVDTGLARCMVCNVGEEKGKPGKGLNSYSFIRMLYEQSMKQTTDYSALVEDRGLLGEDTLKAWGVCRSTSTRDWVVPGYSADGKLNQLYRYILTAGKLRLLPTPGGHGHQLFGRGNYDPKKGIIYVCEGPWDGIAIQEVSNSIRQEGSKLVPTSNPALSLGAQVNVLAVPGCETFHEAWLPLFAGKTVVLLFDNDHPRKHPETGQAIEPAGLRGMQRVASSLLGAAAPPSEVKYLRWGPEGYDPSLPSGHDVRDVLTASGSQLADRIRGFTDIVGRIEPVPPEWLPARKGKAADKGMDCLPCEDYKTLTRSWRKAMKWTEGLSRALTVMLSSITSTKALGDQLWVKIIGPASCGKSTLCEAISVARRFVIAKSTMRGFHSGVSDDSGEDYSLLAKLPGMTLVTKDGDALLQAPNRGQILSEARDLYDTVSRSSYRTKQGGRDYTGIRMTWILCGTSSLRELDSSELGERFLDCQIMEGIDDDLEDEILIRVANRAEANLSIEADGKPETHQDPDLTEAMQLTGGYVEYLRENASTLLAAVEMGDLAKRRCSRLGKFVAYMRARPSLKQEEQAEREFAARLVTQLVRLAKCAAVVLNRAEVDTDVLDVVSNVALDTARGRTLEITRHLYSCGMAGSDIRPIEQKTNRGGEKIRPLLNFLCDIGAAEYVALAPTAAGMRPRNVWRCTERMRALLAEVIR